ALEGLRYDPPAGFHGKTILDVTAQPVGLPAFQAEFAVGDGIYPVTTTADSGPGSLRQAILDANTTTGVATITFAIPGSGVHTIGPRSKLPTITGSVLIDGFSQRGYDGTPLIELSGQSAGFADGLTLTGSGTTVRGLAIDGFRFGAAIAISGPGAA